MYTNVEDLGGQDMEALSPMKRPRGRPPKSASYNNYANMSSSNGLTKRVRPWLQDELYDTWSPTKEERNQIQGAMDILAARNISVVPVTSPMAPVSAPTRTSMAVPVPVPGTKSSPEQEQEHDPDMDFAPMFCEVIVGQSDSQSMHADLASQRMMLNSPPRILDKCYKCDLCPRSYSSRAGLWYHKKAHTGDKQYSCPVCYKRFSQKSHLEVHLNYHRNKGHASPTGEGDVSAEPSGEADVPLSLVTGSRSDDETDLDAAEAPDHDIGNVLDPTAGGLEEAADNAATPERSPKQNNEATDQPSRTDGALPRPATGVQPGAEQNRALSQLEFAQMFCEPVYQESGEAGDAAQQAIRHGSARFNDLIISAIPPTTAEPRALQPAQVHALLNKSPKLDKCYRCELCSNTYSSRAGLWYHRKTHAGSKQYTCRICRQSFTQKGHLQSHMRTHLGDRPYPCGQCEATFTDAASLENHLYTHSNEKPFACRHCSERFPRQLQLIQHERMHVVNKPLKCPHCDRSFALKNNLVNHLRVHRSS